MMLPAFLGLLKPAAAGGGGGLSIVQQPAPTEFSAVAVAQQNLTAVTSGNSVAMWISTPTSGGAPTVTDSAAGSWTLLYSYAGVGGSDATFRFYKRDSATGITWVRATYGGDVGGFIAAVEFSGAGTGLTADDTDGATQGTKIDPTIAVSP